MNIANIEPYSSGASNEELEKLCAWAKVGFPPDYITFLKTTNGGDTVGNLSEYYRFWDIETVISNNEGYEVISNLPQFIGIGDDGGSSMYLIKKGSFEVYKYPFTLDEYYAEMVATNFMGLLSRIGALRPHA